MAAGHQAAFDRIATLVASTASLSDDGSGVTAFERMPSRIDLVESPDIAIHRRFHVLYDGAEEFGSTGGTYSGNLLDDYLLVAVQIGYFEGGGDLASLGPGERHSLDRVAMDDMNRLRQHLINPTNYDFSNTGIVNINWLGSRRADERSMRRIYEVKLKLWVRHSTLS